MNWSSILGSVLLGLLAACSSTLPTAPPPLADMEEPLDLLREPDDEAARRALPLGAFSGLVVDDARDTLAQKLDEDGVLRIVAIVENSPAVAAGLQVGDELLEAKLPKLEAKPLRRPSDWRAPQSARARVPPHPTMVLFIVGLGLGDEADVTLRGRAAIARCGRVWLGSRRRSRRPRLPPRTNRCRVRHAPSPPPPSLLFCAIGFP